MAVAQILSRLLCCLLAFAAFGCEGRAAVIGGWNAARGGDSALFTGLDFTLVRGDLKTVFPGHSIVTTAELTPAFLQAVDVLLLDVVRSVSNVPIAPLSSSEQSALTNWVASGGRALIVVENDSYYEASRSMTAPFGLHWANGVLPGVQTGVIVDHATYPQITNGPFGEVNSFGGWYPSWFVDAAGAASLGTWSANGQAAIAAMKYGAGQLVFFGDDALIANYFGRNNTALRRNTLDFLINVPEPNASALCFIGVCAMAGFSASSPFRLAVRMRLFRQAARSNEGSLI